MNSAAKLRKRSVATLAASALIMGGIAPAAFAWTTPAATTGGDTATVGSFGLIDADRAEPGTQGATIVSAGATSQALGDVRFVVPSTWAAGDHIDFILGADNGAGGTVPGGINTSNLNQVSFVGEPSVNIDTKAYAANTHIHETSGASTPDAGSVEDGREMPFTAAPGATAPTSPTFTTEVVTDATAVGGGAAAYRNVLRVTFTNASNATSSAKFIGSINGAKVNLGANLTGDVTLTAEAYTGAGTGTNVNNFFQNDGTVTAGVQDTNAVEANVTRPATIGQVSLDVANGEVIADGTSQYVGPITVSSPVNVGAGGTASVSLSGARFDTAAPVTATAYDATGTPTDLGSATVNATGLSVSGVPTTARKVVFSGPAVIAAPGTQTFNYRAGTFGSITPPSSTYLGGAGTAVATAPTNQVDIKRPTSLTVSTTTATQVPKRLGGQDRYQTAVKIAEYDLGTDENGARGESDNVVIASGEGFADALSAGYLAATKDAQLILTRQASLPQTDVEFLKTYGAKNIFIVGGNGVVSKAVEDQLKSMQAFDVQAKQQTQQVQTVVTSGTYQTGGVQAFETTNAQGSATPITFTDVADDSLPASGVTFTLTDTDATSGQVTPVLSTNLPGATAEVITEPTTTTTGVGEVTFDGTTYRVILPAITDNTGSSYTAQTSTSVPATGTTSRTITTTENVPGASTDQTAQGDDRKVVPLDTKLTVTRIAGNDRFETNKKVNMYAAETAVNPIGTTVPEYGKPGRKTALLANGWAPWDALAAGPLVGNSAGQNPIPVILSTGADSMNQYAADQIGQMDIKHLLFVGGKGVLPDELAKESTGRNVSVNRLGGDTRWETAKAVSEFALKTTGVSPTNTNPGFGFASATNAKNPYLANGGSLDADMSSKIAKGAWADALAAGPSAARQRTIIALTDSEALPQATKDLLTANKAALEPVIALGLGGVVSTKVVNDANAAVAD